MGTRLEKQIGWLLVIGALIWAAYVLASMRGFPAAYLRLGPMQLLMAGILLWIHGKHRADHSGDHAVGASGHLKKAA